MNFFVTRDSGSCLQRPGISIILKSKIQASKEKVNNAKIAMNRSEIHTFSFPFYSYFQLALMTELHLNHPPPLIRKEKPAY